MTEDEFLCLLGMSTDDLIEEAPPTWYRRLSELYTLEPAVEDAAAAVVDEFTDLGLLSPVISFAFRTFDEGIDELAQRYAPLPFSSSDIRSIFQPHLISQLQRIVLRTLALQVNIERKLQRLQGDTPEERHRFFLASLRKSDKAWALLCDYPVLGRLALSTAEMWVETSLELLMHLCSDLPLLQEQFGVDDLGLVCEVESGAGDAHHGGRTVAIVRFSSGFALVYKPRPMHVDLHMQNVLDWINQHGDQPPFRTVGVLARDGYGWMEFVQAKACSSEKELRCYYARLGGLIALLFALEAVDFHAENIIAAGDQPILVDLESLLHQRKPPPNRADTAQTPAFHLLVESVMRLGIL
jgi:type 2 lantibiotic biosynthesis protein LanM